MVTALAKIGKQSVGNFGNLLGHFMEICLHNRYKSSGLFCLINFSLMKLAFLLGILKT